MGVTIKISPWTEPVTVSEFVSDSLAHDDFDGGAIETLVRDVRSHNVVIARLFQHLADKGLLTADEVESIVRGF